MLPDDIDDWAEQHLRSSGADTRSIIAYCTCPDDATSMAAARRLKKKGLEAAVLAGGFEAWKRKYPVEAIEAEPVPA